MKKQTLFLGLSLVTTATGAFVWRRVAAHKQLKIDAIMQKARNQAPQLQTAKRILGSWSMAPKHYSDKIPFQFGYNYQDQNEKLKTIFFTVNPTRH